VYRIFVGKPQRGRLFGKPGRRWEGIVKTDFKEIRWKDCGMD
jgi:hypothetical protein